MNRRQFVCFMMALTLGVQSCGGSLVTFANDSEEIWIEDLAENDLSENSFSVENYAEYDNSEPMKEPENYEAWDLGEDFIEEADPEDTYAPADGDEEESALSFDEDDWADEWEGDELLIEDEWEEVTEEIFPEDEEVFFDEEEFEEPISEEIMNLDAYEVYGDYQYQITNDQVTIMSYTGSDSTVTIPDEIDGYPVTKISSYAFANKNFIVEVEIPDTVTYLGYHLFENTSVSTISIPKSVTQSGYYDGGLNQYASKRGGALWGSSIKKVIFEDGATVIPDYICYGATGLTEVVIPDSVRRIGNYAFQNCVSLAMKTGI